MAIVIRRPSLAVATPAPLVEDLPQLRLVIDNTYEDFDLTPEQQLNFVRGLARRHAQRDHALAECQETE